MAMTDRWADKQKKKKKKKKKTKVIEGPPAPLLAPPLYEHQTCECIVVITQWRLPGVNMRAFIYLCMKIGSVHACVLCGSRVRYLQNVFSDIFKTRKVNDSELGRTPQDEGPKLPEKKVRHGSFDVRLLRGRENANHENKPLFYF